jgi:RimJ/RimL family protein N-acetyltransferase
MVKDYFKGETIRLAAPDWEADHSIYSSWGYHTEFKHLSSAGPLTILSKEQQEAWMKGENADSLDLMIRLLKDNRLVGRVGLEEFHEFPGNAWMSIEIGDPNDWNSGYGSEATRLIVRFGFEQMNLRRISLAVFGFNTRAIHLYEKFGFLEEGKEREWLERFGQRWDLVHMGLLREDWVEK